MRHENVEDFYNSPMNPLGHIFVDSENVRNEYRKTNNVLKMRKALVVAR
jgi:hypothetical protein